MRKLVSCISLLVFLIACTRTPTASVSDSVMTLKDSLTIGYLQRISQHTAPCYRLYPTENIWTFLELETFSGRIWQVQYSVKGSDYRFKTVLNDSSMISLFDTDGEYAGRFELYKTQNIFNYILLDTASGDTWQVQWSIDEENRGVLKIR